MNKESNSGFLLVFDFYFTILHINKLFFVVCLQIVFCLLVLILVLLQCPAVLVFLVIF